MYIKKNDKELIYQIDCYLKTPKGFNKFLDKISTKHRLIIKGKNNYSCGNCGYTFKSNKKINEECKCPCCKNKYVVKSNKLQHYEFKDWISILDKYSDYWIVRNFELLTIYSNGKYTSNYCEYARQLYDKYFNLYFEITNDNLLNYLGGLSIRHLRIYDSNWKMFSSYYRRLGSDFINFPGNIKRLLNDSKFKYSQLWTLAKNKEYIDLIYLMKNYNDSVELLTKMKLYNLALCPRSFNKKGNFKERFGVDKKFLKFMQKNDITDSELEFLKYYQKENIKVIKALSNTNIREIKKYNVDLDKLLKLTDFGTLIADEYNDYLDMANKLHYDMKDKRILYPKEILKEHDKLVKTIETNKNKKVNKTIEKRYKELLKNTFNDNKFIVFAAENVSKLIEESSQMNNCVKTYAEKIAKGECDIYFMRNKDNIENSLVTIEVRNNRVVQKRTKNNMETTDEQNRFISKWERKVLQKS